MRYLLPLIIALGFAEAPASAIELTNPRNTYGELGGTRVDAPLLPGDVLFVAFDIEGISINAEGNVVYTMGMELQDKAGKSIFKQEAVQKTDYVPLGGSKLPARAYITVGLDQMPGEYVLKVTVTDIATKDAKTLDRKFTVLPKDFGIVAVYTSVDERGQIASPTTGVVGQSLFVQFGIVGFARDATKKQPSVTIEMQPLDEAGKPTISKPGSYSADANVDEKDPGFSVRFLLPLTRPGKFTVRLKAVDKVANKTYTFDLPVAVVAPAN